ncbi:quinolinate phosphoribosyl transferase protein [Sutterella parvirubra YIT 11816]|uniref:Putative pyrophosphorylase ModD n=2 Tax=Sutterella TaxID=40544 RepID=H3KF32_9BURK|nr:quinolinate phosphoribosyl transferase protein [Sutterella parvirubra YIT 11816]
MSAKDVFKIMRTPDTVLEAWLRDDCPFEDLTSAGLGIERVPGRLEARVKAPGLVAGTADAARILEMAGAKVRLHVRDGDRLDTKGLVLEAEGEAGELHQTVKVAQCVMEYASGIANRTAEMVAAAERGRPGCRVGLTRKHMPGTKYLSAAAALAGGGIMHRWGLSDSILVFDQHRVFTEDDWAPAFARLKSFSPERKVAAEADGVEEAMRLVDLGVDILQCERFTPEGLAELIPQVKAKNPQLVVSAAGGVQAANAEAYARAGCDLLVTSWPYFGKPFDVKMILSRRPE